MPRPPSCPSCDYDLRAHDASGVCPECGAAYALTPPPAPLPPMWTGWRYAWTTTLCLFVVPMFIITTFGYVFWPPERDYSSFWTVAVIVCIMSFFVTFNLDRVPPEMRKIQGVLLLMCFVQIGIHITLMFTLYAAQA